MTDVIQPKQPFLTFMRKPFGLSIGRGGRFLWIGKTIVYPAKTISGVTPPTRVEYIVSWGGRWRFRIVPEAA